MNDNTPTLTAAQSVILDCYLEIYTPAESFDPDSVILLNSADICRELENMGEFDINAVTERMVELGYRYHIDRTEYIDGWMLRKK